MGLTRDEIRSVKAQRRTLKNRRYAVDTQWIHSAGNRIIYINIFIYIYRNTHFSNNVIPV